MTDLILELINQVQSHNIQVHTSFEAFFSISVIQYGSSACAKGSYSQSYSEATLELKQAAIFLNPTQIGQDPSNTEFIHVFMHELGHATGAVNRLNRPYVSGSLQRDFNRGDIQYSYVQKAMLLEELTAEVIAQKCMTFLGLPVIDYSHTYVHSFLTRAGLTEVPAEIMSDIETGYQFILENWLLPAMNNVNQKAAA